MRPSDFLARALALLLLVAACGGGEEGETASATESAASGDETEAPVIVPEPGEDEAPEDDGTSLVVGEDPCESDADCAPAACCHAASCVAAGAAPSCEETMCTMECRGGTMDCGGDCLCHEGRCAARVIQPPEAVLGDTQGS